MLHRPGEEIRRLTPRNNDELLFDGVPWVDRAQDEHDAFAAALRARDVEVLYLREAFFRPFKALRRALDRELLAQLAELARAGVRMVGYADPTLRSVRVLTRP
jgi:arginine deiminase